MVDNNDVVLKCPASFLLKNNQDQEKAKGKAQASIEKEKLSLQTDSGKSFVFLLRDLVDLREKDYHLFLDFSLRCGSGPKNDCLEHLDLFNLGYKFEDTVKLLTKNFHHLVLQDMLVYEKIRLKDVGGHFTWYTPQGEQDRTGKCEIRVFETSLVILPDRGQILRIPFGDINEILPGDYNLTVTSDTGARVLLSRLGYQADTVKKVLTDALTELTQKTQAFLQELLPGIDPLTIRTLAALLKDGKIARRKDIEAVSLAAWQKMEKTIEKSPLAEEYDFLKSQGRAEKIAVGFKRGLFSGLKQDYFWFLIPLSRVEAGKPVNVVAFEAGSIQLPGIAGSGGENPEEDESRDEADETLLEQGGKATYFFRLLPPEEYAAQEDASVLDQRLDEWIISINRGLREVNFRREPIYLPDEKLDDPRYLKYKYAIHRLPELRRLRELFIDRVVHKSLEQWKKDVTALLQGKAQ